MYQFQAQNVATVYIENDSMGVCIFNGKDLAINCGQILHFFYGDMTLIGKKLSSCSEIITNQPKEFILSQNSNHLTAFKGQLRIDTIFTLLSQMPSQNINGITNKQHHYNLMMEDSMLKFKALGMLIYHLTNFTSILKRQNLLFESIQYWNDYIFQHVQVTRSQIDYLQISCEKAHPSLIKARVQNALGSSVLRIYNSFLKTRGAQKVLKRLMLNPTFRKEDLQDRHQTFEWMMNNMKDQKYYLKLFKNIYSIDLILEKFHRGKIQGQDWRKMVNSIQSIVQIRKSLPLAHLPGIVKVFLDRKYWPQINHILKTIQKVIQLSPFGIRDDFDIELRSLKQLYHGMPRILAEISRQKNWAMVSKLIFMPQIGYLVEIPHENQFDQTEISSWQLKFTNCNGRFYSNQITKQLDEEYGDVNAAICDIETRILEELEDQVNEMSDILVDVYWNSCIIECYWGISQLGKNLAFPKLSSEELIVIDGWNILLGQKAVDNAAFSFCHEKGPRQKVCNSQMNIVNTNYTNRCSIISGPNGSGKTIYMKQVGIIVYLGHCGFLVPATFAQIPLIDRITVVQTSSSLFGKQTGFKKQLTSMSKIMNRNIVSSKCLVLIDQIGLSQDYTIGLKILYACVRYLSDNGGQKFAINKVLSRSSDHFHIPLTLIITHLTQLMANHLIEENYYVRYLTMDVDSNFDYSFKIKPGLVQSGYGIKSAEGFLKNQEYIKNAYYFWNKLR